MHYILGLRNRKKYVKDETFLSEKFDPHEMLIFSSNYNRTMSSCSSQLQGLYPQKDNLGEILSLEQKKMAYPQVNITDEKINKALIELGNSSLPNLMVLTPVRMVGDLDKKMNALPDVIKNIYFDFDGLTYITSAGLRVLFAAQEYTEDKGGKISVRNVCSQVYDIFTITGFKEFINIE